MKTRHKGGGDSTLPSCASEDTLCTNHECRFHIDWFELGNCTLRVDREHTYTEIAIAFGFSRQRAEQVVHNAIRRYKQRHLKLYGSKHRTHQ